jgi:hypothetical protein
MARVLHVARHLSHVTEVMGGSNSVVESQPSKLLVAGSIPVSRSSSKFETGNSKLGTLVVKSILRVSAFDFRVSRARRRAGPM